MKRFAALMSAILLFTACKSKETTHFSFSGLKWNDKPAEVHKKLTTANFSSKDYQSNSEGNGASYLGNIDGDETVLQTTFDANSRFERVSIIVSSDYYQNAGSINTNKEVINDSYDFCKKYYTQLVDKYGKTDMKNIDAMNPENIEEQYDNPTELLEAKWENGDESLQIYCTFVRRNGFSTMVRLIYEKHRPGGTL